MPSAGCRLWGLLLGLLLSTVRWLLSLQMGCKQAFKLTPKAMEPSESRFSPISGVKRVFGKKVLVNFGIDFLKFMGVGAVLYGLIETILEGSDFLRDTDSHWTCWNVHYAGLFGHVRIFDSGYDHRRADQFLVSEAQDSQGDDDDQARGQR